MQLRRNYFKIAFNLTLLIFFSLCFSLTANGQVKKGKKVENPIPKKNITPSDAYLNIDFGKTFYIQSSLGLQNRYLKHGDLTRAEENTPTFVVSHRVYIDNITGSRARIWKINEKGNKTYTISSALRGSTNKCLSSNGKMQTCDNRYSQDWTITKDKNGFYTFKSVDTGKYLGLQVENAQMNNNLVTAIDNASNKSAKWKLFDSSQPIDFFVDGMPDKIESVCLSNLVRGDRELGSDPTMRLFINLTPTQTSINAEVKLILMGNSGTFVRQEITKNIYSFTPLRPDGKVFGELITPNYFYYEVKLEGHGEHELIAGEHFSADGPVQRIILRADTMGDDISDDRDCNDDSELLLLEFKAILVKHRTIMER